MKAIPRLGRTSAALAAASVLLVGAGGLAAWADNVIADISATPKTLTVAEGGSTTVEYKLVATNDPEVGGNEGCNATASSPVSVDVSANPATGVQLSGDPISFTSCDTQSISVTGLAEGTYVFSATATGGTGGGFNTQPAIWTLEVTGSFGPSDEDGDGVADSDDNCPSVANPGQEDADNDSLGDACDSNSYAPAVDTAASDATGDEGDTLTTSGSFTDGDGTETLSVSHSPNVGNFSYNTATGVWTWSLDTTDDVSGAITVTASDAEHSDATDSFNYSAANVDPAISSAYMSTAANANVAVDCRSSVMLNFSFTDPGTDDTWTATINWGDGNSEDVPVGQGANSASHTYTTGGVFAPTVTVTDDDNGWDSANSSNSVDVDQYSVMFLKPFDQSTDGNYVINKAKAGRTVPVKVTVYDKCAGASVTGGSSTAPSIGIQDATAPSNATSDALEVYSDAGSSNSNDKYFRWSADGFWIYNAETKTLGLQVNKTYRINVRMDGVLATDDEWALLQIVK